MDKPECGICGAGPESQGIRSETVHGGNGAQKIWRCAACGAIYLHPQPTVEEEELFYREEFEKYMQRRSGGDRDWSGAEKHAASNRDQVERRMKYLAPRLEAGMKVLEVGCSSGFMLEALSGRGLECAGVEPSGAFSGYLRARGFEVFGSLDSACAEAAGRFDAVLHFFVLEHVRNPFDFFDKCLRLVKPGGRVIGELPCADDPLISVYDISAFEKFYWQAAHHFYYNRGALSRVLDGTGMKYEILPQQRYDLSNHVVWMTEGKPGGAGRFDGIFSAEMNEAYRRDLERAWRCDTMIVLLEKG